MPFLHWLSFQRLITFIFIFSVCIFKLSFGFINHCLCWLAQHRRKQAKTLIDKTKSRLEGANGKGENESDSPLKTKPLQKGPKRRTNQTGLKKSSCPPASPQLSRSSSSSCVLSSSSECRSSCVLTHILFSFFFLPFTFLILLFIFSATVSDCLRQDANKQKQWLKK